MNSGIRFSAAEENKEREQRENKERTKREQRENNGTFYSLSVN
jgi:hypothetical protein